MHRPTVTDSATASLVSLAARLHSPGTATKPPVIPFNKPGLAGNELVYVAEAITRGHTAGNGVFTARCHQILEKELGVRRALLTTSCTDALEMAALLLGIQPGDEVIVPSFTFVSTVNAFVLRGARPVFADCRPDTLNVDETLVEGLITPRTRAIVPVHYAGVACEMDTLLAIAARHGVPLVEDNAHGLFARYKGRFLGTFGCLATQSFHETKNIICGEGGALLINHPRYVERAEILRDKGTNRARFLRGQVDKYTWVDVGSSFLPSDMVAAFLCAQLEQREFIQARRLAIWERYHQRLRPWCDEHGFLQPAVPAECEHSCHMYYLIAPSLEARQGMIEHLRLRGINSVFHYIPLHTSEMGAKLGYRAGDCPVAEWAADRLLRLPFFNDLTEAEQETVIAGVESFPMAATMVRAASEGICALP
jgi:dTDP-4-amino-4,6-dideoxygalactose transaminase